jgi:hypothetical protein
LCLARTGAVLAFAKAGEKAVEAISDAVQNDPVVGSCLRSRVKKQEFNVEEFI